MTTWIESHQDLRTNPKAKRLARLLDVPLAQAIGHLHMLWWWAVDHASDDGDITSFDALDIADAAGWEGDEKAFVEALTRCGPGDRAGFIEPVDNGRTVLHDWSDYTMALRASREGSARGNHNRWHRDRGIHDPSCRFCTSPPDSPPTRGGVAPDSPPTSPPTRPRRPHPSPPDSSRAQAPEESTDPPTDPPGGRARTRAREEAPTDPTDRTTPPRSWEAAWTTVETYVGRWGRHDPDRPDPADILDPRTLNALRAAGGLTRLRSSDQPHRVKLDFRDAWRNATPAEVPS